MATMDPRRLYRDIVEIEKQLRDLLRSNPLNAQDANVFRSRLMEKARHLADASPVFAAQREIEQVLWKPCFYKRIEDFRRRIRKYAAASAGDRSVREHFARVSTEFQEFLTDAAAFYDHLRESFTKWLLHNRVSRIASSAAAASPMGSSGAQSDAAANIDKCRHSLHRCLVFLGDLARYRELHSQKAKKNFAAAESFYHRALAVTPENGNPHNQLAVLATYVEAETVAVYRYCRSLMIAQPFATAEENLALLFERSRQRPLAPPATAIVTATSSSKDKSAYLKSFLHRLARNHGILFSIATRQAVPGSGGITSPSSVSGSGALPVYSKEMESLLMKDLRALLAAGVIGDALLLKLVVTNIFCIVRSSGGSVGEDALRLSIRLASVVLEFLVSELVKQGTTEAANQNGGAGSATTPSSLRLLGAVSTYTDFLRCSTHVLDDLETILVRQADDLSKRFVVEFLENLVKLLNHSKIRSAAATNGQERVLLLKENIELRGFKPLAALLDTGSATKWRDDLANNTNPSHSSPLSDEEAWKTRAWNVYRFGKFVCEDYEGNPLLYFYKGQFATNPSVQSGISSGSSHKLTPSPSDSAPLFGVGLFGGIGNGAVPENRTPDSADDFDDEVIVYQPSPAMNPVQARGEGSSALGGAANSVLASPFGSDPFSLGGSTSRLNPTVQPLRPSRSSSSDALFSSFGSSGSGIGSSLDYPSFHSFGARGVSGGTSGHGLLSSGWGTNSAVAKPPATPFSGSFASEPNDKSDDFSSHLFGDLDDLDAVERESAMYQRKESSLSAFLGSSLSGARLPPTPTAPMSGFPPATQRSSSVGTRRPPPPGFATASPPGFALSPESEESQAQQTAYQQAFFTRNPFINP